MQRLRASRALLWFALLCAAPVLCETDDKCSAYKAVYVNIDLDLQHWTTHRITRQLLQSTALRFANFKERGLHVGYFGGRAYVLSPLHHLPLYYHHTKLLLAYLRLFLHLEATFGKLLPNTELVLTTFDNPRQPLLGKEVPEGWAQPPHYFKAFPLFRFCKANASADILMPNFHFHMKKYKTLYLDKATGWNSRFAWRSKQDDVFGRFTLYPRIALEADNSTRRLGARHLPPIPCTSTPVAFGKLVACEVRKHFVEWSQGQLGLDVQSASHGVPVEAWPAWKYLLNLDGQSVSSRLEQILAMGSLVIKEESGYYAYYYAALQPHVHYLPFWRERPEELLDVMEWARQHDEEAQRIAHAGQDFALRYLSPHARECYWLELLKRYTATFDFEPQLSDHPGARPVMEVIEGVLMKAEPRLRREPWEP